MTVRPIPEFPQPGTFRQERQEIAFSERGQAVLLSRLDYVDLHGKLHSAMPGLLTDGRSGPVRLLGSPWRTEHRRSALIHDAGCAVAKMLPPAQRRVVREAADRLYRECLLQSGASRAAAWWHYQGVSTHGWWFRARPACDWRVDFASPEAAAANRLGILGEKA